jgi:PTH2 family peptidyl-tRNA hydrolase
MDWVTDMSTHEFRYKQAIILRNDIEMTVGKAAVQAAHGSILSYLASDPYFRDMWLEEGMRKVILGGRVDQIEEFPYPHERIVDFGITEFGGTDTFTGIALHIELANRIDPFTKPFKLYKGYIEKH